MRLITAQGRLREMAVNLRTQPRIQFVYGQPGDMITMGDVPEGALNLHISHTLAMQWADHLDKIAAELDQEIGHELSKDS